ncbi:peptidylprolyl isomerase [Rubrivirga sp. IMCC45206]|uniref:peptidylprolyl isomerase n=1 Tax=Rubrivirga sp. IMCC45206 TaxID=3391614 RepID=UPI00398FBC99
MAQQYDAPPAMQIDPSKSYRATIATDKGDIVVDLAAEHAPKTVNNFVTLARDGFYDGLTFHRVINNFMIQGGDPTGTGSGGPGYKFEDETRDNPLTHETGVLSMANAGPNTNGSQFFITHAPQPHLNGKHTVFGTVAEGQDVVDAIQQGDAMTSVTIDES